MLTCKALGIALAIVACYAGVKAVDMAADAYAVKHGYTTARAGG